MKQKLRDHGIQPSAQRMAVANYVLDTHDHPTADRIWTKVSESFPMISRATVYNTLHLLVEKGLLKEVHITGGSVVYDPKVDPHHHFIDDETGSIHDVPWGSVDVCRIDELKGFDVEEYQVVMRGRAAKIG
ncbi:MAG: transcriptional repressor [Acidobacteria bacterium]|nr:transcriptional repressor [Acidobacteriota bacterium]